MICLLIFYVYYRKQCANITEFDYFRLWIFCYAFIENSLYKHLIIRNLSFIVNLNNKYNIKWKKVLSEDVF